MTDVAGLYERAMEQFGDRLRAVQAGQWDGATPCADWTVRDLANHVIGDALDGDLLGDDPAAAWDDAAAAALAAARDPGALERTVHLSFGDFPGRYYVGQVLADHVIHAWDLARAIGADEKLEPELVRFAYDELTPQLDAWRSAGAFGPKAEVAEDADLQTKLLAEAGRSA